MPRDGSGNFTLGSGNPVVPNTIISSTGWANPTLSDIAAAITASIAKDGQTTPTGNLPMGNFRHTNVANAVSRTDYAAAGQVQDSSMSWLTTVSGTDTITAALAVPPLAAYVAGQSFRFAAAGANTTTSVTLNINGLGAKSVTRANGTALVVGEIAAGSIVHVTYDGTNFQINSQYGRLINVQVLTSSGTYTPTPGTNSVVVEIQGPGGAGGGAVANGGSAFSAGAGGGAGGYLQVRLTSGFSGVSVVVGAPGLGVVGANGGTGGSTSFGSYSCSGGSGGVASGSSTAGAAVGLGGLGGSISPTVGVLQAVPGMHGLPTFIASAGIYTIGAGGGSKMGQGGSGGITSNGNNGFGWGAGGGGVISGSGSAFKGGDGSVGKVIVWEYA